MYRYRHVSVLTLCSVKIAGATKAKGLTDSGCLQARRDTTPALPLADQSAVTSY